MKELYEYVEWLHKVDAYHRKRGFRLSEASDTICTNHLIEEAVELQAEVLNDDDAGIVNECSDLMACVIHLLVSRNISIDDVQHAALKKLGSVFTTDKDEVLTSKPGFARSNRE